MLSASNSPRKPRRRLPEYRIGNHILGLHPFEIIMRRHETRSSMMTSNRPLEDWSKLIGDVPSATAILDRFIHHAHVINITGKSYRLRNQARNDNKPPSDESKVDQPAKEDARES